MLKPWKSNKKSGPNFLSWNSDSLTSKVRLADELYFIWVCCISRI